MRWQELPADVLAVFRAGTVIPAHPLALDADRQLDERRQRALTRYYLDAGAGGLAVGVHTTQFAIRDVGLYAPSSSSPSTRRAAWTTRPLFLVAGVCRTHRAGRRRGRVARDLGYHAGSSAWRRCRPTRRRCSPTAAALADELPVIGFYLQPAVGGVLLSRAFWTQFAAIENVVGIKVAPFDRYRTLDVVRGVAAAGAQDRIALYTGNDDHIVLDLTVPFRTEAGDLRFVGGLLGHWSVWTRTAVEILERCHAARDLDAVPADLLALDSAVTDCNAAFFDVAMPSTASSPAATRSCGARACSRAAGASTPRRT